MLRSAGGSEAAAALPQTSSSSSVRRHLDDIRKHVATMQIKKRVVASAITGANTVAQMISPDTHRTAAATIGTNDASKLIPARPEDTTGPRGPPPRVKSERSESESRRAGRVRPVIKSAKTPRVSPESREKPSRDQCSETESPNKLPQVRLLVYSPTGSKGPWEKSGWVAINEEQPTALRHHLQLFVTPADATRQGVIRIYPRLGDGKIPKDYGVSSKIVRTAEDIMQHIREQNHHRHWNVAETYPDMSSDIRHHRTLYGLDNKSRVTLTPPTIASRSMTRSTTATKSNDTSLDGIPTAIADTIEFVKSGKDALHQVCAIGFDTRQQVFGDLWSRQPTPGFDNRQPTATYNSEEESVDFSSLVVGEEGKEVIAVDFSSLVDGEEGKEAIESQDSTSSLGRSVADQEVSDYFSGLLEKKGGVVESTTQDLHPAANIVDPKQSPNEAFEFFSLEQKGSRSWLPLVHFADEFT